jgi:hypothetical protein
VKDRICSILLTFVCQVDSLPADALAPKEGDRKQPTPEELSMVSRETAMSSMVGITRQTTARIDSRGLSKVFDGVADK